jgi:hypothetical protein
VSSRTTSAQAPRVEINDPLPISISQYRLRISQWGFNRHLRPNEMKCIVRKQQARRIKEPHKPDLEFRVRGLTVAPEKIDRFMRSQGISVDGLYLPSSGACE